MFSRSENIGGDFCTLLKSYPFSAYKGQKEHGDIVRYTLRMLSGSFLQYTVLKPSNQMRKRARDAHAYNFDFGYPGEFFPLKKEHVYELILRGDYERRSNPY